MAEEKKIDVKCCNCGNLLFKKVVTGDSATKEFGGVEITCRMCGSLNVVGIIKKLVPIEPTGRITYRTK